MPFIAKQLAVLDFQEPLGNIVINSHFALQFHAMEAKY